MGFVLFTWFLVLPMVALSEYRLVCYYTNWAQYRLAEGDRIGYEFVPEDINPELCTHIIFSFAYLAEKEGKIVLDKREWNDWDLEYGESMYRRFTALKKKNPSLKTLLAVGGWTHPNELFTQAVGSRSNRTHLINSVINILREYDFDGFDLDWEYPGSRGSPQEDKRRFTRLVKETRVWFEKEAKKTGRPRLLLSAAVASGKEYIENGYQIGKISKHLDFINLMAYDLHGHWESTTNSNAPLFSRSTESEFQKTLNVKWAVKYWKKRILAAGESASKLNLGMAAYGQSFTLQNPHQNGIGANITGPGTMGRTTLQDGFLAYYEICTFGGERVWDEEQKFPYRHKGDQWVSFDDMQSLKEKVDFLKKEGLGGAMFWALDLDDFKGEFCDQGNYPLINFVRDSLHGNGPAVLVTPSEPGCNEEGGNSLTGKPKTGGGKNINGATKESSGNKDETKGKEETKKTEEEGKPEESGFTCVGKSDGVYVMPENCHKFHHCFLEEDNHKDCPAGLLFDSRSSNCVWPVQSDCKN